MHRLHHLLQVVGIRAADGDQVHRLIGLNADGDLADEAGDAFRLADHVEILALEHLYGAVRQDDARGKDRVPEPARFIRSEARASLGEPAAHRRARIARRISQQRQALLLQLVVEPFPYDAGLDRCGQLLFVDREDVLQTVEIHHNSLLHRQDPAVTRRGLAPRGEGDQVAGGPGGQVLQLLLTYRLHHRLRDRIPDEGLDQARHGGDIVAVKHPLHIIERHAVLKCIF